MLGEIQAAWSNEDVAKLHTLATPEMVSYFTKDLEANRARNVVNKVSDIKLLQGDLAEAWREGDTDYASVAMRYSLVDKTARSHHRPAGRRQRTADRGDGSLDIPAAARRQLGTLGDPADLIACKSNDDARRRGSFRGAFCFCVDARRSVFGVAGRNNVRWRCVDVRRAGAITAVEKTKREESMPNLVKNFSRVCSRSRSGRRHSPLSRLSRRRRNRPTPVSSSPPTASAMAPISAVSPAPTITARRWRRPRAPAPRPGAPISRRKLPTASPR